MKDEKIVPQRPSLVSSQLFVRDGEKSLSLFAGVRSLSKFALQSFPATKEEWKTFLRQPYATSSFVAKVN